MSTKIGEKQRLSMALCRMTDPAVYEAAKTRFEAGVWPTLLKVEGGFSDQITDQGGPTIYGVTWRTLKDLWARYADWCHAHELPFIDQTTTKSQAVTVMKRLRIGQAQSIAFIFYYGRPRIYMLKAPWDLAALDWRYNGGPVITGLQKLAGVGTDGIIGPLTCGGVSVLSKDKLELYFQMRLEYLQGLKGAGGWAENERGWTKRLAKVKAVCLEQWPASQLVVEPVLLQLEEAAPAVVEHPGEDLLAGLVAELSTDTEEQAPQ